jgi:HD-like signal output (HDOD) protein
MIVAVILISAFLGTLGLWAARHRRRQPQIQIAGNSPGESRPVPSTAPHAAATPCFDATAMDSAISLMTERLWRLAYAAPLHGESPAPAHARVREAVFSMLHMEKLDHKYFPRRPTLMPQLLRAMEDPRAATDKLSRIVAHDPVLAADVLRLSNSSLYRLTPAPSETLQRAIVVLGAEALRGLVATAMLQPIFRATRTNFPRFPRMLWERTERASRAAELYARMTRPRDRFEAQLAVLLNALGPLVAYGAALDVYATRPALTPDPTLCVSLTSALGPQFSLRIARHWETSSRLLDALAKVPEESLSTALRIGELLGTLSLLETHEVISHDEAVVAATQAGVAQSVFLSIYGQLQHSGGDGE